MVNQNKVIITVTIDGDTRLCEAHVVQSDYGHCRQLLLVPNALRGYNFHDRGPNGTVSYAPDTAYDEPFDDQAAWFLQALARIAGGMIR